MLLSICIPTYNGEKYIQACLDSILNQEFKDFEIIICDDCSTDKTTDIIKANQAKDARINLLPNKKNLGMVGNWNQCIENAKSEWIKFVFQDDIIMPDCIGKMLLAAKANTNMVICERKYLFEADVSDAIKKTYAIRRLYQLTNSTDKVQEITIKQLCKYAGYSAPNNFLGEPSTTMFRKSCYQYLGGFASEIAQLCDLEYWLRIGFNYGFIYVNEPLVAFRVHMSSASLKNNTEKYFISHYIDKIILMNKMLHSRVYENFIKYTPWSYMFLFKTKFFLIIYNTKKFIAKEKSVRLKEDWDLMNKKYPEINNRSPFDIVYYSIGVLVSIKRALLKPFK